MRQLGSDFVRLRGGGSYGQGAITDSFRPTEIGIEQAFHIAQFVGGTGPLVIDVPVSGLTAVAVNRTALDLKDASGQIRATYSGLLVTDAAGRVLVAKMQTADHGHTIAIEVDDTGARYPLTVDPTWSDITGLPDPNQSGPATYAVSVALSGSTAVVGAMGQTRDGEGYQSGAYVFNLSDGTWSETTELTVDDSYTGNTFGDSVAISGTTILIGAPGDTANGVVEEGAAYVFNLSDGTWSQTQELTPSDGEVDYFGSSVALSGTIAVVGAYSDTIDGTETGAAYVFNLSDGTWSQTQQLSNEDATYFGLSVALSGTTIFVGAPATTVGDNDWQGAVYVFNLSDGTWYQAAALTAADGASSDEFGFSLALSGTTAIVGALEHSVGENEHEGAAYVFNLSGGTWSETTELIAPDGAAGDEFGGSVALSGTTAMVGAQSHTVNGNSAQGAAYVFSQDGGAWPLTSEVTAPDGETDDFFGHQVALSGTTALVAAPLANQDAVATGVAYVLSSNLVQPQGTEPGPDGASSAVGNDGQHGGSPSVAAPICKCDDPVDLATGDFYENATDLSLPGAGIPLSFSRSYDAQSAQEEVSAGTPAPPLGYGWADNLGMTLTATATTATVTEDNGAQVAFASYVSGTSPAWCTAATNFCSTAPRVEATLNQNEGGTWTFVRTLGSPTTFTFSSSGALTEVADEQGDTLSSSGYSPSGGQTACPSGDTCTAWTSSASGRELVLAYNSSGELSSVFDANSTLAANFAYSGSGCSTWSGSETPDLCRATDPGGIVASYTYDSANSAADLDYDMLTLTPPGASAATTNIYNSSGQVTQQTDPSGAVTTFSYAGTSSSLLGGTTTVTNYPLGTGTGEPQDASVYQFSNNVLVGETTGSGTASASTETIVVDPVSLLPLSAQDGDGNVSNYAYQTYSGTDGSVVSSANLLNSTDAVGNTTEHAYNSFNQAWCTVSPAEYADGVTCPSTEPTSPPTAGATDPNLGVELSFYNSSDQLTATTDALGNTTKYSYTSSVSGVPNGLLYCSVGPVAYQADVTCPAYGAAHVAGTTTSTYDSAGDLTSSTNADGNTTSYVYAATGHPGLVSSETGPNATTTTFTYNGAGEVTTQVVSFGSYSATTQYAYDSYGRQFCTVAPYEYAKGVTCPGSSPSSPPTRSDDPYLGATITTYDADGRVVQLTSPLGGINYSAYDQAGELFCTVAPAEAALGVTCPSTAPSTPPTVGDDPYLGATITTYDANGRPVQVTGPLGGITLTSYDPANNVLQTTVESNNATTDPNVVTSNNYDADNRVVSTTVDPGGGSLAATTLQAYDPDGNVYCAVSANAYAAGSSAYQCPPWQPGWVSSPPNPPSLYSSTPTSAQANNVTTIFYDANGDQLQSTDPDVHTSVSTFDGDGRTYCSADPTNVSAWLTAHPSSTYPYLCPATPPTTAPVQGSNPGYVTTIFDPAGRVLSSTDQVGDTTAYTYAPGGQVLTTTNPRGYLTTNCYYYESATGQCAHSAPAGGGSADDLYSTTTPATSADPSGEVTDYTYYPGDQPDTTTTPAGTETDAYDAYGDLTSVNYSSTASGYTAPANVSYTYKVDGSIATMTDATGTTTYGYDGAGDVTSQVLTATATDLSNTTTSYGYFSTGALASLTYPAYSGSSDPKVNYTYDATGAMASGTDWEGDEVTFAHDGDGNETAQDNNVSGTYPAGTSSTAWSYDAADNAAGAASGYACSGGTETLSQSFSSTGGSINPDGQLTQYSTSYAGSCSAGTAYQRDYSYDLAGRVVYQGSAAQGSNANNFAYDPAGDPTKISSHDSSGNFDTYSQVFDGDGEVTAQSPVSGSHGVASTYAYDTLGDQAQFALTATATTAYGYDQVGQLASATTPVALATYLYNGDSLEARDQVSSPLWGPPTTVDSTRSVHGVSCPTTSFCAAVDTSGYATVYNGTSWSTPSDIDGSHALEAVSCTSSSFCKAVDNDGEVASYNGTSWSVASAVDSTRTINAISCPTTTFCAAVDNSGYITTYNGTSWATAADKDGSHALEAVSCTSSSYCVATDNDGNVLTYNGTSWSSATSEDSTRTVHGVSCPTTSFCAAVDTSGYATTYNGTSWSTPSDIDGSHAIEAVSCTSSSYCVATDNDGNVLTYNGTSWSADQDIDSTRTLNAISCASPSLCTAVDASGYGVTYAWSTATSQLSWDATGSLPLLLSDGTYDYIYGPGTTPVEQVALASSTPTYLTYTEADSTWLSTNATGDKTGFWGYDAFGNLAFGTPASAFGYAGQYSDATTGLSDMRARWYAPSTGEFTSVDPALAETGQPYAYAGDDPVNEGDPSGLRVCFFGIACVGGGTETTSVSFGFHPMAGLEAWANIGRGATFGLTDRIDNWISPGSSCLLPQNGFDEFLGQAGTSIVGGELLGGLGSRIAAGLADSGAESALSVETPYGAALQENSSAALAARSDVEGGATVYRIGTTLKSQATEGQFWSLENPATPGYAARYGLPAENVANADFVESGVVPDGTSFITRGAPGIGENGGGGIEVVVPSGGVQSTGFSYLGPKGWEP
jgi:RHS repeat-associated protein